LESDSYDRYVRAEWALLSNDPARGDAALDAVTGLCIARVLDIGCGAGQELRPFLRDRQVLGVGLDISPEVGRAGRQLFASEQPESHVTFVRAAAERLPFEASRFDLVICRLALPYTDNATALGEIARVLRPGGALLLKIHHAKYYLLKLREALATRHLKSAIHACRVLFAGCMYHLTGSQPRGRLTGGETFQTMWLLRRELRRRGLHVQRRLPDSVPAAPNLLIVRQQGGSSD
jgi:SAM-dependent methyltransferase